MSPLWAKWPSGARGAERALDRPPDGGADGVDDHGFRHGCGLLGRAEWRRILCASLGFEASRNYMEVGMTFRRAARALAVGAAAAAIFPAAARATAGVTN